MAWYPGPGQGGPQHPYPPQNQPHFQQQQVPSQSLPPQQVPFNNQPWQSQSQQPHQQPPVNYHPPTANFPQQQPPANAPGSWNHATTGSFFKPTDVNQNFAPNQLPPTMNMANQPQQQQQTDGWGDWGDEWAANDAAAAVTGANNLNNNTASLDNNYNLQQQLPPPAAIAQPHYNDPTYQQQSLYAAPANYPAPPPVDMEGNVGQDPQQHANVIANSFSNSQDSWNWNSAAVDNSHANQATATASVGPAAPEPVFNKMSHSAINKLTSAESYNSTNQPDDMKATHPPAAVQPAYATEQQPQFNQQSLPADDLDPLDMALMQMNAPPQSNAAVPDNGASFFGPSSGGISLPNQPTREEKFPATGGVENQEVVTDQMQPNEAVPMRPPPPAASPAASVLSGPPPAMSTMPPPQAPTAAGNPFKRSGAAVHRNLAFNSAPPPAPASQVLQPPAQPTPPPQETAAPVPTMAPNNNDRNAYLQTDQLSEDVPNRATSVPETAQPETLDSLPPPGLSRLVLGETEEHHNHQQPLGSFSAAAPEPIAAVPPPGLNRMVPGTDHPAMEESRDLQPVDGENALDEDNVRFNRQHGEMLNREEPSEGANAGDAAPTTTELSMDSTVPAAGDGDSAPSSIVNSGAATHAEHPPSRVVTGDENTVPFVPPSTQAQWWYQPTAEEPRDLQPMDGENSRDDDNVRFSRQHREEPIEGANAGDDVVISSGGAAAATVEPVTDTSALMTGDGGSAPSSAVNTRKETSTGEDSDREKAAYYGKQKSGRGRAEDTGSLRRKPKHHERYDSESDNSEHRGDQRKYHDRSYASEKHRGGGGEDREGRRNRRGADDSRHNRTERGGDRRYDQDYDRGGYGKGEERRSKRYYDDERDEAPRRRDGDSKRADKERQYRKERDRDRDERRGDYREKEGREEKDRDRHRGYSAREKDRRYEYDDERYNRSGSRNTDRSRDPRYAGSGYYGPSYGYDHYAYYTQQQQQQMQYYENLRRTNPQAYAEWYRKYYMQASGMAAAGTMAGVGGVPGHPHTEVPTDGRESVHSGRSSTNDKDR